MQQKSEKFLANLDLPLRVSVKLQPAGRATGLESCPYRTQSPDEDSTASEALLLHNWALKNAVLEDEHSIELESGSRKCDLLRTLKHNLSARAGGVVYSPLDTCYGRGEGFGCEQQGPLARSALNLSGRIGASTAGAASLVARASALCALLSLSRIAPPSLQDFGFLVFRAFHVLDFAICNIICICNIIFTL